MYTKKIVFVLCFLASSFMANSQTLEKGTWLVGGELSYLNANGSNLFLGNINSSKMVSKSVALGIDATYITPGNVTILGPQVRYYFNGVKSSKLFFLGNLGIDTSFGDIRHSEGVGLANFLNDYVSVDIIATYGNSFKGNGLNTYRSDIIGLQVGLQIYLPKKK
jgi:hypothetical protein